MKRPIIKGKTIMERFKKDENLTLNLIAESYHMTEEEFLESLKKVVGKDVWNYLNKTNSKRLKAGKGKPVIISDEEETQMKARVRQDFLGQKERIQEQHEEATKPETSKEEKIMTTSEKTNIEEIEERLATLNVTINSIEGQIDILNTLNQESVRKIEETMKVLSELRDEEAKQEIELQEKQMELKNIKEEKEQLTSKLDMLNYVILVAPHYGGKVPKNKKVVSTIARDGVEVETVPKDEWMTGEPTLEKMMNSGFDSLEKFLDAYEFVQLVLRYQTLDKKYELRCSDRIREMIISEGGEA